MNVYWSCTISPWLSLGMRFFLQGYVCDTLNDPQKKENLDSSSSCSIEYKTAFFALVKNASS